MYRDFKELLSILNDENVKDLVVGGYAVSLHAQPRATKDLDILIRPDKRNAIALFRGLAKFGAPLAGLKPDDFAERGSFFRMGTPPVMVDILPEISGVDFDHAWRRRVIETIDATTGLKVPFISADDLIAAKEAAGRTQDLPTWRPCARRRPARRLAQSRGDADRPRNPGGDSRCITKNPHSCGVIFSRVIRLAENVEGAALFEIAHPVDIQYLLSDIRIFR